MADRIIRDELLESDRWLDLPTDACRLAFMGFILICDDFGNFEGGLRRLYRFLHKFTQIKTEEASASAIDALMACDLIRRYTVAGRELFHIPRFKSHRQYLSRQYPPSPWCHKEELGKEKRVFNKGLAKNVVATSHTRSTHVAEGVGVGVGVGVGEVHRKGLSISPTRVKVKTVFKKTSEEQNQDQVEKNRRIAIAMANGNVELAKRIKAGRA